jgi:hypothetical protein
MPKINKTYWPVLLGGVSLTMTVIIYTIYWFVVATTLKSTIEKWVSVRSAEGIFASYRQIEITGFPLSFRVVLTDPKIKVPNLMAAIYQVGRGEKWMWKSGRAIAEIRPWNFNKVKIDLSGSYALSYEDGGGAYHFVGKAQKIFIAVEDFADGWPKEFLLNIAELSMIENKSEEIFSLKSGAVISHSLLPDGKRDATGAKSATYVLKVEFHDVHLPRFLSLPLGHEVQNISTELKIIGFNEPSVKIKNLAKWRDSGGSIEVILFEGSYGTLKTYATGTVALDESLQPLAAISARFQGFFPAISKLEKAGYIRSGNAAIAKLVLGLLSKRTNNGVRSISLPLTLQGGRLSAGPVELMAVPKIDWGKDLP